MPSKMNRRLPEHIWDVPHSFRIDPDMKRNFTGRMRGAACEIWERKEPEDADYSPLSPIRFRWIYPGQTHIDEHEYARLYYARQAACTTLDYEE